jgi:hypothetical protein
MKNELEVFDNHLMDGLLFCKRVYDLFDKIKSNPNGIKRIRLRKDTVVKKLIEELIPIARYIQTRYSQGRRLKIRWIDGGQHYDAKLLSTGFLVDMQMVPKKQYIEVTTAVHENDHVSRKLIVEKGGSFGTKGIVINKKPKSIISNPYVYRNGEAQIDLKDRILARIKAKNKINYPSETVLVIQCILDTLLIQHEWDEAINELRGTQFSHNFSEVFLFDSNHHYSATIYGNIV